MLKFKDKDGGVWFFCGTGGFDGTGNFINVETGIHRNNWRLTDFPDTVDEPLTTDEIAHLAYYTPDNLVYQWLDQGEIYVKHGGMFADIGKTMMACARQLERTLYIQRQMSNPRVHQLEAKLAEMTTTFTRVVDENNEWRREKGLELMRHVIADERESEAKTDD